MTKDEIVSYLKDKVNWTKSRSNEDLWTYCKINTIISVGRQRFDWAIFKRNNNKGFYFEEYYQKVPKDLVNDLYELLEKHDEM